MSTGAIIAIGFFAFATVLIVIALAWGLFNKRKEHRHVEAGKIRDHAREETLQVRQREALAEQTAAQAHAAQAEAEVKAAEATALEQQAAAHRGDVASDRDRLDKQWDRADKMDPAAQTPEAARSAERK
jgi:FtsP/CotA-like multicopper oxidase with cupredoxin domain